MSKLAFILTWLRVGIGLGLMFAVGRLVWGEEQAISVVVPQHAILAHVGTTFGDINLQVKIPQHRENAYFCLAFGIPSGGGRSDLGTGDGFSYFRRSCQSLDGIYEPVRFSFMYPAQPVGSYVAGAHLLRLHEGNPSSHHSLTERFSIIGG